jgi:transcriptional regulator with XRE-family HTH domain
MADSVSAHRFGEKLRYLRKERNLTMQALSYELGTSSSYISQVENGQIETRIGFALRVARFFGVSVDDLVDDAREVGE